MIAATKKVLSPTSERTVIARDFVKPSIIETPIVVALVEAAAAGLIWSPITLLILVFVNPIKISQHRLPEIR